MPENTAQNGGDPSETEASSCPACGSGDIDDSIPALDPVCEHCGVVVSVDVDIDLDREYLDTDSEGARSWEEHHSITNSTELQVAEAFERLEDLGDRLHAPMEVREQAADLYTEAAVETFTDGRSADLVVAACLREAGRDAGAPVSTTRIARAADIDADALRRICSAFKRELEFTTTPCPPEAYLHGLVAAFELGDSVELDASRLLAALPPSSTGGKAPGVIAGAALYLAADGAITQRDVAEFTGLTTETVRLRVNDCRAVINQQDIAGFDGDIEQCNSESS